MLAGLLIEESCMYIIFLPLDIFDCLRSDLVLTLTLGAAEQLPCRDFGSRLSGSPLIT